MHEYRLEGEFSYYKFPNKDEWAVSRIFHKSTGIKRNPFIFPTSINPYENNTDHILEYCSNISPLPSLVENPTHSSLIDEDEMIEQTTKSSSQLSIDRDDDNYLSYLSTNLEDRQLQSYNTNYSTPQNYNNQISSIKPNYSVNFYPQIQGQNPIRTFANQAILRAMKEEGTSSDAEKQCKMEQLSSNQSMVSVSQDTVLSTDVTAETSSRPTKKIYELLEIDDPNLNGPNNFSDGFDYLWDY